MVRSKWRVTDVARLPGEAEPPLWRPCPRCGARPGERCVRRGSGRIHGQETGGGYDKPLKNTHPERASKTEETQ